MISFSELADWLATNPWFGVLGFIAGVIGIILTIRSKKEKLPFYAIRSNNIIRDLAGRFEPLEVIGAYLSTTLWNYWQIKTIKMKKPPQRTQRAQS